MHGKDWADRSGWALASKPGRAAGTRWPCGQPLSTRIKLSFYKRWQAMRKLAGLGPIRFHDLRHTADTLALDGGASVLTVMKTMGHTSRSMTLDRYRT